MLGEVLVFYYDLSLLKASLSHMFEKGAVNELGT